MRPLSLTIFVLLASEASCDSIPEMTSLRSTGSDSFLTSVSGVERAVYYRSYVYVPVDADDDLVERAIVKQAKTAMGPLSALGVSPDGRDPLQYVIVDQTERESLFVFDPAEPSGIGKGLLRVHFQYNGPAVVADDLISQDIFNVTLLAGDYARYADDLMTDCSDNPYADPEAIWYYFRPQQPSCLTRIANETAKIDQAALELADFLQEAPKRDAAGEIISKAESERLFVGATVRLGSEQRPVRGFYPEYDRLFGVGTSKQQVVAYVITGIDASVGFVNDRFGIEHVRFLRQLLRNQPHFGVSYINPEADLTDVELDGKKIAGVTQEDLFAWIIDNRNFPPEVGSDPLRAERLRWQARAKFVNRWIYWDLPVAVTAVDETGSRIRKYMTIQLRTFYGDDGGSIRDRQGARQRYLEAFRTADLFVYNGHSYLGEGALDPSLYRPGDFSTGYQLFFFNSCSSFNYFGREFIDMKPGGSQNLDVVVNGLRSGIEKSGDVVARFLLGVLELKSYEELLSSLKEPEVGDFNELRLADGEQDNVFSPVAVPLTVFAY